MEPSRQTEGWHFQALSTPLSARAMSKPERKIEDEIQAHSEDRAGVQD